MCVYACSYFHLKIDKKKIEEHNFPTKDPKRASRGGRLACAAGSTAGSRGGQHGGLARRAARIARTVASVEVFKMLAGRMKCRMRSKTMLAMALLYVMLLGAHAADSGSAQDEQSREEAHQSRIKSAEAGAGSPASNSSNLSSREGATPSEQVSASGSEAEVVEPVEPPRNVPESQEKRMPMPSGKRKVCRSLVLGGTEETRSKAKAVPHYVLPIEEGPAARGKRRKVQPLSKGSEDEQEETPMLRSSASLDRTKHAIVFGGTQPPVPSGNTLFGGWGGSAARQAAGITSAAQTLRDVSVASSLAMAASHTPGRSNTSRSGAGGSAGAAGGSAGGRRSGAAGGGQAGAAGGGEGGSADAGAQPRFATAELVTLLATEHDFHEFMHLDGLNLWIVSETEHDSNIMLVVYQHGNQGPARSIEVPINMLQQRDEPLPLPTKCKTFIATFFAQAAELAKFSRLKKQTQNKVNAIAATPDILLITRANSRVAVQPTVPAYRGEPNRARELFEQRLAYMGSNHDAFPPPMPDEAPSRELQKAAAAEAAAARAAAVASDAIITRNNEELARAKKEARAAALETRRLLQEIKRREERQSEEEGNSLMRSLFNADIRNDARAQEAQERQSRLQQDDQLKRDKQRRTSPAFLIRLISQVTSVVGQRQNNNFRGFKLDLMAKIAKWADGKTFFKMDGQWVRIVQFEISYILQSLTMLDHDFKYASLNMTDAQTLQGGNETAPLPADRLIIVARDRQDLDNAALVVDRFDEDGHIERVLVWNSRLVKEVKATKKRAMPPEVDELNPHGRPPQETYNFTELLNVPAAGASAPARDATEDAVDAALEAQLDQPDEETGCISPGLLRSLSMNVGEASTTSVNDDSVLARVSDIVLQDQQQLISLGGIESTANDIAAGSAVGAEAFVEISGAVIAHLHTSTFIRLMMDVWRARKVLNILNGVVLLNPEQLHAIYMERHLQLHADKNVGKPKEWQVAADKTLAEVVAACNLLRKHYYSTRDYSYRVADPASLPAVAAGSTEETAAASRDHRIIEDIPMPTAPTRTLTMAAPELIAWCVTEQLDYKNLMFSRWNQELGKWVWDQHANIPAGHQLALKKELALSLIRHHALTAVQDSSAAKGEADAAAASAIQRDSSATARPGLGGHHGPVHAAGTAGGGSAVDASGAVPATGSEGAMPAALPTASAPELQESSLLTVTVAPAAEAAAVATLQAVVDAPAARAASAGSTAEGAETQQEDTQHYAGIDGSTQAAMQPGTSRGL